MFQVDTNADEPRETTEEVDECPERVPTRYQMTNAHRDVIAALVKGGATANGFRADIEAAVGNKCRAGRIIPDAFHIDREGRLVRIFEVEVSHFMEADKKKKLIAWTLWLRAHGWDLRFWTVDRRGHRFERDPITYEPTTEQFEKMRAAVQSLDFPLASSRTP